MDRVKYYYGVAYAADELKNRQSDSRLLARVVDVMGDRWDDCPYPLGNYAYLARQIATCQLESWQFAQRAIGAGLSPVWMEYVGDRFTVRNPDKNRLCKIVVDRGIGRNGGRKQTVSRIVAHPSDWEGAPISLMRTDWGRNLVEFHRELLKTMLDFEPLRFDAGEWYGKLGCRAEKYYPMYLMAMTIRGVLFESFDDAGSPEFAAFNERVVYPAYRWVLDTIGVEPLIVYHPLVPNMGRSVNELTGRMTKGSATMETLMRDCYHPDALHVVPFL